MIIVCLSSGLGNQMFQYAFALYLKEKYKQEIFFDINKFNFDQQRKLELNIICPNIKTANYQDHFTNYIGIKYHIKRLLFKNNPKNKLIQDDLIIHDIVFKENKLYYFDGYWQTDFYINQIKDIETLFSSKESIPPKILSIRGELENCNSVSIHVRRGDYFSPQYIKRYGVCTSDYYKKSIDYIYSQFDTPVFFIFSDDIDWVKKNLQLPKSTMYIEKQDINSFWYIQLMSKCKHNIISNSTFSWWGAYLNSNKSKIVISPDKWMLASEKTIALKSWIKIKL